MEEVDFDNKSVNSTPIYLNKPKTKSVTSTDTNTSFFDEFDMYVDLPNMPAVVMYSESCTGTMDELLELSDYAPINSPEKEKIWSAWLFQVIAALAQLQGELRLTHNDLHTNNVLWKETKDEFLWYRDTNNRCWKVPTYGRIFTIIDFGRAIFSVNNFYCISSDYQDGRNAAGQYNFGPLEDSDEDIVYPNKSFDLSRLSCSLIRGLFPYNPPGKTGGKIITKESNYEVKETVHEVFNLLWSWLKADNGSNILEMKDGDEKFPGFDLYIQIAHTVHNAIPLMQLNTPAMKQFLIPSLAKDIKTIIIPA